MTRVPLGKPVIDPIFISFGNLFHTPGFSRYEIELGQFFWRMRIKWNNLAYKGEKIKKRSILIPEQSLSHLYFALNKELRSRFGKYLASPFFEIERRKNITETFVALEEKHDTLEHLYFEPEELWEELELGTVYDAKRFSRRMSEFNLELVRFLGIVERLKNPRAVAVSAVQKMNSMPISVATRTRKTRKADRLLRISNSLEDLHQKYHLQLEHAILHFSTGKTTQNVALDQAEKDFEYYVVGQRIKLLWAKINANNILGSGTLTTEQLAWFEALEDDLDQLPPVVQLYFWACRIAFNRDDEAGCVMLYKHLSEFQREMEKHTVEELYRSIINFYVHKINKGNTRYISRLTKLYDRLLTQEILFLNGQLPPETFKNLISLHCQNSQYDQGMECITQYIDRVDGDRDLAFRYNKAVIHYFQGKSAVSMNLLKQVLSARDNPFYRLDARIYMMRIQFDDQDIEGLVRSLESFRKSIDRANISEGHRENFRTLRKYFRKLVNLSLRSSETKHERLLRLHAAVQEDRNMANFKWLELKIWEAIQMVE